MEVNNCCGTTCDKSVAQAQMQDLRKRNAALAGQLAELAYRIAAVTGRAGEGTSVSALVLDITELCEYAAQTMDGLIYEQTTGNTGYAH